jgi:hypothetical protein
MDFVMTFTQGCASPLARLRPWAIALRPFRPHLDQQKSTNRFRIRFLTPFTLSLNCFRDKTGRKSACALAQEKGWNGPRNVVESTRGVLRRTSSPLYILTRLLCILGCLVLPGVASGAGHRALVSFSVAGLFCARRRILATIPPLCFGGQLSFRVRRPGKRNPLEATRRWEVMP